MRNRLRIFATLINFFVNSRMNPKILKKDIFEIWRTTSKKSRTEAITQYILENLCRDTVPDDVISGIKVTVRSLCQKIEQKWSKSGRHQTRFLKENAAWLEGTVSFSKKVTQAVSSSQADSDTTKKLGRPPKDFSACSRKTKIRKVQRLVESTSQEELAMATEIKLLKQGKRDSAAIVKELAEASPERGTTIKNTRRALVPEHKTMSSNQALAVMVDSNLSTHQYKVIRQQAKSMNCRLYPPYYKVKEAKELCYPSDVSITEISAEIKLQSLIDHTTRRLCTVQEDVIKSLPDDSFDIVIKWGCDGADQKRYRQKFSNENFNDESLFSVSMVPIQIYSVKDKKIVWKNLAPSSTRYCRPIKFMFAKETTNLINTEIEQIKTQVTTLLPTKILFDDHEITVTPRMVLCMIDGKICNAVASCASTQTCYLCGAKPRDMNNINALSTKQVNQEYLSLGLSPLHSWIRFFECILHISYRLEIKTWQVRGAENKNKLAEKKKYIQDRFRKDLGILVDMPKQQTGNTNDGNTARKFFRNPEKSSEITGVNLELIKRFHIILECLNSGYQININKFEEFAKDTRELYIKEYPWYSMPVSVHKVLFHGKDIIASCILPIGQMSEEAQEARNKNSRKFRELFTRKTSRIDTNTDLLHTLLITSDPIIASLRAAPKTLRGKISLEVQDLLEQSLPTLNKSENLNASEDDDDGDDD